MVARVDPEVVRLVPEEAQAVADVALMAEHVAVRVVLAVSAEVPDATPAQEHMISQSEVDAGVTAVDVVSQTANFWASVSTTVPRVMATSILTVQVALDLIPVLNVGVRVAVVKVAAPRTAAANVARRMNFISLICESINSHLK